MLLSDQVSRENIKKKYYNKHSVVIPESVSFNGVAYDVNGIGDEAFRHEAELVSVELPEGLEYIGLSAFRNCENLSEINLPTALKTIGWNAFCSCFSLKTMVVPNNVTEINHYAFAGCEGMRTMTIGRSVNQMGTNSIGCDPVWINDNLKRSWITRLENLYCLAPEPPSLMPYTYLCYWELAEAGGFQIYPKYNLYEDAVLHVPSEYLEAYKSHEEWGRFTTIVGDAESGINDIASDNGGIHLLGRRVIGEGMLEVYDLSGRTVARGTADELPELPVGFYVVRNHETSAKIVIR